MDKLPRCPNCKHCKYIPPLQLKCVKGKWEKFTSDELTLALNPHMDFRGSAGKRILHLRKRLLFKQAEKCKIEDVFESMDEE